jgi:HEAT repeat protein
MLHEGIIAAAGMPTDNRRLAGQRQRRSAVECETDGKAAVEVYAVGWRGFTAPRVEVLIDDQPAGVLNYKDATSFPVLAGVHKVSAKLGFLRSKTLGVSLAAVDRASLECGFRMDFLVLLSAMLAVFPGLFLALLISGLLGQSYWATTFSVGLAVVALVAIHIKLVWSIFAPGGRLYLKPRMVTIDGHTRLVQIGAPSYLLEIEPQRRGFQFGLKGLLILVACCAPIFWVAREVWDRRPENRHSRAIRMLRSKDSGERITGASDLQFLVVVKSLAPKQIDAVIPELLVALRDQQPDVRKDAAVALFFIVFEGMQSSGTVPQTRAIAEGLAAVLGDSEPAVRHHSALSLASLYFTHSGAGRPPPPLPQAIDRFVDLLGEAIEDTDAQVRSSAFLALQAIAPRVARMAPARLVAAVGSKDTDTRAKAVQALVKFPNGIDSHLPLLLEVLEREDPKIRQTYSWAFVNVRPSAAAIPALVKALRSPERPVRFLGADLLSRIGPSASSAVPAILPLLEERFEPETVPEYKHPEWADPAVPAIWALRSIAPGTPHAELARSSLLELSRKLGHPWRRDEIDAALRCFSSAGAQDPEPRSQ